jgi:hypothetical protein
LSRAISRLWIVVAFALAVASKPALAQSDDAHSASATAHTEGAAGVPRSSSSLNGFDVLATAGWGAHTGNIVRMELAPYGASFGIDLGYTWRSGFRLGGYFFQSLGRSVQQPRESPFGRDYEFVADTSSFNGGLSLGWDVPLYRFLLRYQLGLGVTAMHWDFHGVSPRSENFDDDSTPSVGLHVAPGVALLWPHGLFEGGLGFEYLAQVKGTIPSGIIGTLLLGVRL